MVSDMSESRLIMLFIEALAEPLCGWVKAYKPITLQDAISRTRYLQYSVPKNKPPQKPTNILENKENTIPQKEWLIEDIQWDLRRKNLCFNCKDSCVPGHKCMGKGKVHLIEVLPDSSEEDELEQKQDGELHSTKLEQLPICHRERLLLPSQESPPSILSGSREVSRDSVPLL